MYREHTSHLGNSMQVQKDNLIKFVKQCEDALVHNNPDEPNEVYILGDMNLDSYLNKWMSRYYSIYSLAKIIHDFCHCNNLYQLVNDITRAQYNSIQ